MPLSLGFLTTRRTFYPSGGPMVLLKGITVTSILLFHALFSSTLLWICPCPTNPGHPMLNLPILDTQRCSSHHVGLSRPNLVCLHPCSRACATLARGTMSGTRGQWQPQRSHPHHHHPPLRLPRLPLLVTYWITTVVPRLWVSCAASSANAIRTASHLVHCSNISLLGEIR